MKTGKTRQALLISGVGTLDIVFNDDTDDDTETLFSTDGTTLWEPGRSQKAAADIRNEGSLWLI